MVRLSRGLSYGNYGLRNYDPQIARFTQLDPLTWDYPELTKYQYAGNDPIANVDLDGLEKWSSTATQAVDNLIEQGFTLLPSVVIKPLLKGTTKNVSTFGLKKLIQTGVTAFTASASAFIDNMLGTNVTDQIAKSGAIPSDQRNNWNTAVTVTHYASVLFGLGESTMGGGLVEGAGSAMLTTGGLSLEVSAPTILLGGGMMLHGGLVMNNASRNLASGNGLIKGGGRALNSSSSQKYKSLKQLNNDVKTGRAPRGIKRYDKGRNTKNLPEDEVTFDDNSSLYRSGKWRHNYGHKITNKQREYLKQNGWTLPD